MLLDEDNSVETANPAAPRWLDELDAEGRLPLVVHAVAGRARRTTDALAPRRGVVYVSPRYSAGNADDPGNRGDWI